MDENEGGDVNKQDGSDGSIREAEPMSCMCDTTEATFRFSF